MVGYAALLLSVCWYLDEKNEYIMTMNRLPVKSSHIKSIGHEGNVLEVEYTSGALYRYNNVEDDDFNVILANNSIGKGVAQAIHRQGVVGVKLEPDIVELV